MIRRLLIRPGAIGDLILSLPALEALRADYTEVWVASQNNPLVQFADHVRSISTTGLDLLEVRGPTPELRDTLRSFDEIVSWYGANRDEFRSAVAGLPFRFLTALPNDAGRHATDYYLDQVGAPAGAAPCIRIPETERTYAVVHPFSGSAKKNWPLDCFRAVAAELSHQLPVCWCAGPEEPLDEAARFDDLHDLACWLAGARLYIGNDSGPTHLAAAVGTPVVALYGPTDPRIWAPRGPNVRVIRSGDAMADVGVADVLRAAKELL